MRIDYADGFIAYLNGREIARRNVDGQPGSAAPVTQLASAFHYRGEPLELDVTRGTNALVSGCNTFALQLHAARRENAGLSVSAELLANANRSPFLQNMTSNQVQIIWKTPISADTRLRYGKPNGPALTVLDGA